MIYTNQRHEDCKSSIIGSIPIRASIPNQGGRQDAGQTKWLTHSTFYIKVADFVEITVEIKLNNETRKLAIFFEHKGKHRINLNCSLSELTEKDVCALVETKIKEIDNVVTLCKLLEFILECDECGGNLSTRKKVIAHFKDYCKREGICLSNSTKILLRKDELNRTLPERWQDLYKLPHKLRQVRSLFSRKNLVLFDRLGWDTSHFGNFVSFVPETSVSQPFSTSDVEVQHIIDFFNKSRDQHPVFYDIYLLAFGCGLRQSEIYQIRYEHFIEFNGQCFLMLPFATKRTKLKGIASGEKVGISRQVFDHFRCREMQGQVVAGGKRLHKRFIKFLKNDVGITEVKACHRLRKILGARLASSAGIYHAAKTLRNSVQVAERYYSDLVEHRNELEV